MFVRLLLGSLFVIFTAQCSKKQMTDKKPSNILSFNSPVTYVYKKIEDPEQAAMIKTVPVSWSQLRSQDLALQELQMKYDHSRTAFVYAWAKSLVKDGAVSVTALIAKPKEELTKILLAQNVEISEQVQLSFEPATDDRILAKASGKSLTREDYLSANISHAKLYRNLFTQRMRRLDGIVVRRYLLEASKEAKMPMEDYVKANILNSEYKPSEEDVRRFAKDKGISESDLNEKMLERLADIVKQNDRDSKIAEYVAKNLIKEPVQVAFKGAPMMITTPEMSEDVPRWGEKGPELVYIGHWNCDNCPKTLKAFLQTKEKAAKGTRGAFVYSFAERDREARMGAEASLCVGDQGTDSYWTFLSKVIDIQESDIEKRINTAAEASGIDYEKFRDCFLKRKFQQAVDTHLSYAKAMGITRLPLLVVKGQVLEPPFDGAKFSEMLGQLNIGATKSGGLWARVKAFLGF